MIKNHFGLRQRQTQKPTVANVLRAARFGFYWSDDHSCFIRLSFANKDHTLVQVNVCPVHLIQTSTDGRGNHGSPATFIAWWETPAHGLDLLRQIQPLKNLRPTACQTFIIGLDGQEVLGHCPTCGCSS